MISNSKWLTFLKHFVLLSGLVIVIFPIWVAFVASTHPGEAFFSGELSLWPGNRFIENYTLILGKGMKMASTPPLWLMLMNSLIMAMGIAIGKVAISILSAFAIVYFQFRFRMTAFWLIFLTLMLPVEVRILPTYEITANLGLLNSYPGLILPLIASATATFLFRQVFMTIPDELTEAARIDGAGPMKFFFDILLPMSRTNIAALFVILFIYGWNQYLWPLIISTDDSYATIVMGIKRMVDVADSIPQWHMVMATAILAMVPPLLVVISMQKLFVKGLTETDK